MRINKFLAECELGSRRKVEELIAQGKVKLNGQVVTSFAVNVLETDEVLVNDKHVFLQTKKVYVMLNKPKGYLCSTKDEFEKQSVLKLLPNIKQQIYPVGRLDYNTEGLLVLTNDGEFANSVIHPKHEINKQYEVIFYPQPTVKQLKLLQMPMIIDDYTIKPAVLDNVVRVNERSFKVNITIHEGRNRQIRKMFEQVNLKIINLKRNKIGSLTLGNLKTGQHKLLTKDEISKIFN